MFVLQEVPASVQIGGAVMLMLTGINTASLAKMAFAAGRLVQKVDEHERRIGELETNGCGADDCPIKT